MVVVAATVVVIPENSEQRQVRPLVTPSAKTRGAEGALLSPPKQSLHVRAVRSQ